MVISPGELAAGQKVSVLEWLPREDEVLTFFGPMTVNTTKDKKDGVGHVLEVKAVSLPFVLVENLTLNLPNIIIDTRELKLIELKAEYAKKAANFIPKKLRKILDNINLKIENLPNDNAKIPLEPPIEGESDARPE